MKQLLLIVIFAMFGTFQLPAQTDWTVFSIEQLVPELAKLAPDHPDVVEISNEIAFQYYEINKLDLSDTYAQKALELALKLENKVGQASSWVVLGHNARVRGDFQPAESHYLKAMEVRQKLGDYWGTASCLNSLGVLALDHKSEYPKGIEYIKKGLEIIKLSKEPETKNNRLKIRLHDNYADLACRSGDYETAVKQFAESRALRGPDQMAELFINEGACQLELGLAASAQTKFQEALKQFLQEKDSINLAKTYLQLGVAASRQNQLDSALFFWQKAESLNAFLDETEKVMLLKNRGSYYLAKENHSKALQFFEQSIQGFEKLKNYGEVSKLYFDIGMLYYRQKKFKNAIHSYERCRTQLHNLSMPELEKDLYYYLASSYAELNQLKEAYEINKIYSAKLDSLRKNREGALGFLHDDAQKLNEKLSWRTKILEQYNIILILVALVLGLFLLTAISLVFYNTQKRKLALSEATLAEQRLGNALKELELERNYLELEDSEKVLTWVSKELHDRLGAMLSTIKLYFADLGEKMTSLREENKKQFQEANDMLDEVCEEVRRISRGALPINLPNRGLVSEVEHLVKRIKETQQIEAEFATFGMKSRLETTKERKLYRIINILINNVLMHAKAKWFSLQINHFGNTINILLEDDGIGYDQEKVKQGTGLKSVNSLCAELGATIKLNSEPQKGTLVNIDIPVLTGTFAN